MPTHSLNGDHNPDMAFNFNFTTRQQMSRPVPADQGLQEVQ
jgi:hypothetical protein